jgi:hypothetical protein
MQDDFCLVVTEYPKSGGTWLTSLIGDILSIPKRDLYVTEESISGNRKDFYRGFREHPWYIGSSSVDHIRPCVMKSHELPGSPLEPANVKFLHLIRDGRDAAVSRYFYDKDFCVKNGLTEKFDTPFGIYITNIAIEWKQYVEAWEKQQVVTIKYENLLKNTEKTLMYMFDQLGIEYSRDQIRRAIAANKKTEFSAKFAHLYKLNTFVRKGIAGDWKNHFTKEQGTIFYNIAGDLLCRLGYARKQKISAMIRYCRKRLSPWKRRVIRLLSFKAES